MPNKIRAYECLDCGAWTRRPRKSNDLWICIACSRRRIREAQLRRWHGPKA